MTPPRRPRGEKPAATIRILRRQLATAQHTIEALQLDRADKEKVIAGYDVQLSEAQDAIHRISKSAITRRERHIEQLAAARIDAARLAFLEGYYAKSQETLPTARPSLACDQSYPHSGERPRDPQNISARRPYPEGRGQEQSPAGLGEGVSQEVRHQPEHHSPHSRQNPMDNIKITGIF